jgi:hypothetical protein
MGGFLFPLNRCEPTDLFAHLADFYNAVPLISCDLFSRVFTCLYEDFSLHRRFQLIKLCKFKRGSRYNSVHYSWLAFM